MINGKEKPDALPLLINNVWPVNVLLMMGLRKLKTGVRDSVNRSASPERWHGYPCGNYTQNRACRVYLAGRQLGDRDSRNFTNLSWESRRYRHQPRHRHRSRRLSARRHLELSPDPAARRPRGGP